MNKQHWNTIICDGTASRKQIEEWIDDSYNLIVSSLTKKLKTELENL
jgi:predicted DNA-binding protein (MmcQ/YjbR family)